MFGSVVSFLVRERFDNLKAIEQLRFPNLIINCQKDTLIPHSHAKELHLKCTGASKLIISLEITHNEHIIY